MSIISSHFNQLTGQGMITKEGECLKKEKLLQ